jgi:hypothetical protein
VGGVRFPQVKLCRHFHAAQEWTLRDGGINWRTSILYVAQTSRSLLLSIDLTVLRNVSHHCQTIASTRLLGQRREMCSFVLTH